MDNLTNKKAFDIVLDLAEQNVIAAEDLADDPELEAQQVDQLIAIMLVKGIRDALVKEEPKLMLG